MVDRAADGGGDLIGQPPIPGGNNDGSRCVDRIVPVQDKIVIFTGRDIYHRAPDIVKAFNRRGQALLQVEPEEGIPVGLGRQGADVFLI